MGASSPATIRRASLLASLLLLAGCATHSSGPGPSPDPLDPEIAAAYFPPPGDDWEVRSPDEVGMDPALLAEAVEWARKNETPVPVELRQAIEQALAGRPDADIVGPIRERGGPNGLILRNGYIVAEWGDTRRVDMAFEVGESFLSAIAGMTFDRGAIRRLDEPVKATVNDGGFDSPRNARVTWHHLLTQTSEWEGTLWGKPDRAARKPGPDRPLAEPGTFWEQNEVRVNRLALSLLRIWRQPLPDVLEAGIMDPIGASDRWEWHGYRTSFVDLDGRPVQSVTGSGYWGGGLRISARDMARFGLLHLRQGQWQNTRVLSREWLRRATSPSSVKPTYGYLWWLNTNQGIYPSAPATSYFARGLGVNLIWVDPKHDLVAVVRWMDPDAVDGFIRRVLAAIRPAGPETPAEPTSDEGSE